MIIADMSWHYFICIRLEHKHSYIKSCGRCFYPEKSTNEEHHKQFIIQEPAILIMLSFKNKLEYRVS